MNLSKQDQIWTDEIWGKIKTKMEWVHEKSGEKIPYSTINGTHDDKLAQAPNGVYGWTNGFWPGILWLMYYGTKQESYRKKAEALEVRMDAALYGLDGNGIESLHHDVGFMWELMSVANYRLTQDKDARRRGLIAANSLMSRFQPNGGYFVAWPDLEYEGWSIVDSMMNLPLLHWASQETGLSRYRDLAMKHADKTIEHVVRPDGSVNHIVVYDPQTGECVDTLAGQGYAVGSSWSRGASWALYGFALEYHYTKEVRYLDASKRVAHYFLSSILDDFIPRIDFRQPAEPNHKDTSAGAVAACGLIEIAQHVDDCEKDLYLNAAIRILRAMEAKHCDWSENEDGILMNSAHSYNWCGDEEKNINLIYGDFFFIEAILKLRGMEISFW